MHWMDVHYTAVVGPRIGDEHQRREWRIGARQRSIPRIPDAGKISILPTKAAGQSSDLALAYSPGVAAACEAIVETRSAFRFTARGNLVGVITNGTAVLGLGNTARWRPSR